MEPSVDIKDEEADPASPAVEEKGAGVASSVFNLANTILGSGMLAMSHVCRDSGWVMFVLLLCFMGVLADKCGSYIVLSIKTVEGMDSSSSTAAVEAAVEDADRALLDEAEGTTAEAAMTATTRNGNSGAGCIRSFGRGKLRRLVGAPIHVTSYQTLARRIFGTPGEIVASLAVVLQQVGACTVYVVAFADMLHPVIAAAVSCDPEVSTGFVGGFLCKRAWLQLVVIIVIIFPLCMLSKIDSLKYVILFFVLLDH